ncbi:DUF6245 family protein [Streptosporangium sp. NPDC002544]|uniref:DUF6245 family protein n=1 Tax=Streptosporangium sp. NPDC002544 TaxID=3154538 RepID=UPI0033295E11
MPDPTLAPATRALIAHDASTGPIPLAAAHTAEGLQRLLGVIGTCPTWSLTGGKQRSRFGPGNEAGALARSRKSAFPQVTAPQKWTKRHLTFDK